MWLIATYPMEVTVFRSLFKKKRTICEVRDYHGEWTKTKKRKIVDDKLWALWKCDDCGLEIWLPVQSKGIIEG